MKIDKIIRIILIIFIIFLLTAGSLVVINRYYYNKNSKGVCEGATWDTAEVVQKECDTNYQNKMKTSKYIINNLEDPIVNIDIIIFGLSLVFLIREIIKKGKNNTINIVLSIISVILSTYIFLLAS